MPDTAGCLAIHLQSSALCPANLLGTFGRTDVEDLNWYVDQFGKRDHALYRFALDQGGLRPGMIFRVRQAGCFQAGSHPLDGLVVLGVDDDKSLILARGGKHCQRLAVGQEARLIGQEELDGAMTGGDQRRHSRSITEGLGSVMMMWKL